MSPRRHFLTAAIAWAVLSVLGVVLVLGWQIIPVIASREADIENSAFVLLTAASIPVLMLVVVGLVYSALRFRATDETADGPPIHGHTGFQASWLGASLILVLGLFAYGAIGLVDIRGAQTADFEVQVEAEQWAWHYEYANGVNSKELHIPVDRRVHLIIKSDDVIHSFWVPAFGVKQDAVPGRPTQIYMTATQSGTYPGMCSELCGLGHTSMTTTVVVSDQAEVDTWLSEQPIEAPSSGPSSEPSKEPG
ncbi:MAG: cytochrome c oxidase subunit [Chloroflexota bacterium]|nr:cytochrome c oxidase subunit [Chloroflexota bacterium]MEA2612907.1 cytochrome c oxidase subunit [Chloroflexota bacterium]